MNTLTEIYATAIETQESEWQRLQTQKAAAEAARAGARAALLRSYLVKWEPLYGLLGLKGQPVLEEDKGRMVIRGQSSINGLPVLTMAYVSLWYSSEFPNLELTICAQADPSISNGIGLPYNLPADQYAERMGALCTIWMELYRHEMARRAAAAAALAQATATAERVLDLARRYVAAWQAHQLECDAWAAAQVGALWERHTLWQIRYPALFPDAIKGQATTHIATAVCLEDPADILNQLKAGASATITIVRRDGEIQEREIAGFLDAERMAMTEHNFEAAMNYHRTHHGPTGVVVNVPAHILHEPAPAPDGISWPQFLQTHEPTLAAAWLGIWPDELVEMTAAEIVERMGLTEE